MQNEQNFLEYRCSLAECTVSSGADRSERSEDKNGTKNFWNNKILRTTAFGLFFNGLCPIIQRPMAYFLEYRPRLAPRSLLEKRACA